MLKFFIKKPLFNAALFFCLLIFMPIAAASATAEERQLSQNKQLKIADNTFDYQVTGGTLILREPSGDPMAELSYVAYTLDDAEPSQRPITFFWDGGPGGATFAENFMGFGPQRYFASQHKTAGAPYQTQTNPYTLLPQTDLVFIDPVGTGYSKALGHYVDAEFWGVEPDAEAMAAAIVRYLQKNQRWQSPKFLFGTSYGTSRASVLAHKLQSEGVILNGVMLFGSALNFAFHSYGLDHQFLLAFPSFAATAWHHGKTQYSDLDLPAFLEKVNDFVQNDYGPALFAGNQISAEQKQAIAEKMAGFIGLDPQYIKDAHLRVSVVRFRKELLRDQGFSIGRMDSRQTSQDFDNIGEEAEADYRFLETLIIPARVIVEDFYNRELGLETTQNYQLNADGAIEAWRWNLNLPPIAGVSDRELAEVNIFPQNAWPAGLLATAMRTNPSLRVFQAHGYYDMATPFSWGDYDLAHMTHNQQLKDRITTSYYDAGHVIYSDDEAIADIYADLKAFYEAALAEQ